MWEAWYSASAGSAENSVWTAVTRVSIYSVLNLGENTKDAFEKHWMFWTDFNIVECYLWWMKLNKKNSTSQRFRNDYLLGIQHTRLNTQIIHIEVHSVTKVLGADR